MPFKVSSRPKEGQVIVQGLAATEPMRLEDAIELGRQILAECNHVRKVQATMRGEPEPALETAQSFDVPERDEDQAEARAAVPANRSMRRPMPQTSHQGATAAAQTSAVHSAGDK